MNGAETYGPLLLHTFASGSVENMDAFLSRIGEKQTSIIGDGDKLR